MPEIEEILLATPTEDLNRVIKYAERMGICNVSIALSSLRQQLVERDAVSV